MHWCLSERSRVDWPVGVERLKLTGTGLGSYPVDGEEQQEVAASSYELRSYTAISMQIDVD